MVCLELGMKVKDKVTDAEGTITAIATHLYGENEYLFEYLNKSGFICSSWYVSSRFIVLND